MMDTHLIEKRERKKKMVGFAVCVCVCDDTLHMHEWPRGLAGLSREPGSGKPQECLESTDNFPSLLGWIVGIYIFVFFVFFFDSSIAAASS